MHFLTLFKQWNNVQYTGLFYVLTLSIRCCCRCALCVHTWCEITSHQYVSGNSRAFIVLGAESYTGEGDIQALNSVNYLRMVSDFWTESDLLLTPSCQNSFIIAVVFLPSNLSSVTRPSETVTLLIHQRQHLSFTLLIIGANITLLDLLLHLIEAKSWL